jgi:hypothetical protein
MNLIMRYLLINTESSCALPLKGWLQSFLVMYFAKSTFYLAKVYFTQNNFGIRNYFDLFRFLIFDTMLLIWLIIGNSLYLDQSNDCAIIQDSRIVNLITSIILVWGYVFAFMYFLQAVYLPVTILKRCLIGSSSKNH